MRSKILLSFVLALCLVGSGARARRQSKQERARQHFIAAKAHYAAQRYRAAIGEFRRARRVLDSPLLDFNIARCYEGLGSPREAVRYYVRYLRRRPRADNRAAVEARIAVLKRRRKAAQDPYEDLEQAPPEGDHHTVVVAPLVTGGPVTPVASSPSATGAKPLVVSSMPTSAPLAVSFPASAPMASMPPAAGSSPAPPQRHAGGAPRGEEKSLLRQWWFWTALGVGALIGTFIIVTTATSTTEGGVQPARGGLSIAF